LLFGIICWSLWKTRNDFIFSNKNASPTTIVARILAWTEVVTQAFSNERKLGSGPLPRVTSEISWQPAQDDCLTLNTDGCLIQHSGKAIGVGLLRNSFEHCLLAFTLNLGICSTTRSELRAAISGLEAAWDAGFQKIALQLDSKVVV
ncbi:Putative ribonuclease H protein At1g65750, partial [Linum perenne]